MEANEYVHKLADAAEERGLDIVELESTGGSLGHKLVLRPGETERNRHTGTVRIEIDAIDLLATLQAIPSFRKEEG